MDAYKDIYEQYVDEASFLWVLRSIAVDQPHYDIPRIEQLEKRIEAQLDGLMTSMEDAWGICHEAVKIGEPGEVFTASIIAFRSHDINKIQLAVEAGLTNDETKKGLISALGWLPDKLIHSWIEKFLASKELDHKYLALSVCSVRRQNPGEALTRILQRDDCKAHEKLYARALRLIGEIRRQDLVSELEQAMLSDRPEIKFWANWSAILLGNRECVSNLKETVFSSGIYQQIAIDLSFRVLPIEQGRLWISELGKDGEHPRAVIKATGILGDPQAVNWLISKMGQLESSRLAAEAFYNITGIDLVHNQLVLDAVPVLGDQPNDDAESDDISLDEDENLPWPDTDKIRAIWVRSGRNYISGQRCFMGRQINHEILKSALLDANQRQRHAAALELALIDSSNPLPNTRAKVI